MRNMITFGIMMVIMTGIVYAEVSMKHYYDFENYYNVSNNELYEVEDIFSDLNLYVYPYYNGGQRVDGIYDYGLLSVGCADDDLSPTNYTWTLYYTENLNISSNISSCYWIKPYPEFFECSLHEPTNYGVSSYHTDSGTIFQLTLNGFYLFYPNYSSSSNTIPFGRWDGEWLEYTNLTKNEWYHVCYNVLCDEGYEVYIKGEDKDFYILDNNTQPSCDGLTFYNFGHDISPLNDSFIIDEKMFFDDTLSSDDVSWLYNDGDGRFWNGSVWNTNCLESWIALYNPESCPVNESQLKYYFDLNSCGTYNNLPLDNGTYVNCTYTAPLTDEQLVSEANNKFINFAVIMIIITILIMLGFGMMSFSGAVDESLKEKLFYMMMLAMVGIAIVMLVVALYYFRIIGG